MGEHGHDITPPGAWMEGVYMYAVIYEGELWVAPLGTELPVHGQPTPPLWLKFPTDAFGHYHALPDTPNI
jgi:hypothetical protein